MLRQFFHAAFAAAVLALAAPGLAVAHDGVHINQPYVRAGAQSGAVFMVIVNHAAADDRLIGAATDAAKKAELHTHIENADGVMQMVEVPEGFVIPAEGQHELARGGDHVMLMGLTRALATGDTISLTLTFERAGDVTVEVPVDNDRAADAMGTMNHDGHAMQAGTGHAAHAGHGAAKAVDTTGMTDPEAVAAVMKAQFDTPENPLTVDPVVIEGDHALASWAQGETGGRALLERRDGVWTIVLCGGPDLRMPAFLADHGVGAAETLSRMFNDTEDGLGPEKVALFSSFEGVVMIAGPAHSN
jgi:periplasmic copper chaperone A